MFCIWIETIHKPIEPNFYNALAQILGLDPVSNEKQQMDRSRWAKLKKEISAIFRTKTRDEWCNIMENKDVCFTPVLSITESYKHPHIRARKTFLKNGSRVEPAPAPRFSRTPGQITDNQKRDTSLEFLRQWGLNGREIGSLLEK